MEDRYRLVFRGEVLEGQHTAVVKKKLGEALKVEGARLDEMFVGRAVIIKRDTDTATAARYQAAFKNAGARLRVLPVADRATADVAKKTASPKVPPRPAAPGFTLRPAGSDLLDEKERQKSRAVEVDVSHLSLAAPGVRLGEARSQETPVIPDTSQFTLAERGADLGGGGEAIETLEVTLDPDWEVAEPGAQLGGDAQAVTPAIDVSRVNFDVAPRGADLGQRKRPPPPPAPDTSHLKLA